MTSRCVHTREQVTMTVPNKFTTAQINAAIAAAIRAEDFEAVNGLMHMLAVQDPAAAQAILHAVDLVLELNDAQEVSDVPR